MDKEKAVAILSSLLGKTLRIHTSDTRMFVGQMKCTDKDRNVILGNTHEYRLPTESNVQLAAAQSSNSTSVKMDMTSRYVGLVVVPGQYITKIEVEEWTVQGAESDDVGDN